MRGTRSFRVPGAQGVPSSGSSQRSRPHQPATRQASTSHVPRMNRIGLVLTVPANR